MFIAAIPEALLGALVFTALCLGPGLAWVWTLAPRSRLETTALALTVGLPLTVLPAVLLAEWGRFSAPALWCCAAALTAAGFLLGRGRHTREGLRGWLVIPFALAALWALPLRGEWLVGGWDPGVNVNQGLLLARTGSIAQPDDPLRAGALHAAPGAFARDSFGFTEVFPGLPADPETGALEPYFYRGTPTLIAIADTVAGRPAALRINHATGIFALLLFGGLLASWNLARPVVWGGIALLAAQPILLAHLATPASEMTELAVLCGAGLLLRRKGCPAAIALALLLLLGAVNRVSFLFLLALLLPILALWDAPDDDRSNVTIRHLALAFALTAGLAWYTWVTPDSLVKLRHLVPALHALAGICVVVALVADAALARRRVVPTRSSRLRHWARAGALIIPAALLVRGFIRSTAWLEFPRNVEAWFAYAPPVLAIAGGIGLLAFTARSAAAPWIIWLVSCTLMVLLQRHAAELYPWATKRWLAVSPPLIAAGCALALHQLHERFGKRGVLAVACAATLLLASAFPAARAAWRSTEYDGAAAALDALALHLHPDDLVVADHFRWGTPLALAQGFTVLSAEPLLAGNGDAERAADFLAQSGRRVVLVSSSPAALDAWPETFRDARPLHDAIAMETQERIQHRSNRGFDTQPRRVVFQAAEWKPAP
ncbi:MAG TPA: hypothetical protein PKE12_13480 [Kiritimatiellia bacterium]|nr:hypothetical protein [Kiritimatiellia bacterium]